MKKFISLLCLLGFSLAQNHPLSALEFTVEWQIKPLQAVPEKTKRAHQKKCGQFEKEYNQLAQNAFWSLIVHTHKYRSQKKAYKHVLKYLKKIKSPAALQLMKDLQANSEGC